MRITTIARIGTVGAGALLAFGLWAGTAGATPPGQSPAGPAHGVNHEDSTCFTAGGPQGRPHSDPDGMTNGGADKPGCPGGFDADQDGNNGCGNDADREDDNNGNCGPGRGPGQGADGAAPASTTTTTTTVPAPPPAAAGTAPAVGDGPVEPTDCEVDPREATDCPAPAGPQVAGTTGVRLAPAPDATGVGAAAVPSGDRTTDIGAAVTDDVPPTPAATAPGTDVLAETLTRPGTLARTGAGVGALSLLGFALLGGGRLTALARRLLRIG
ncbi:MAG TPA: hypothetical protein VHL53_03670 [Acidimicrobiia bacterium]|nr:hypothetical protein [Acidimicrobiia bacterium]